MTVVCNFGASPASRKRLCNHLLHIALLIVLLCVVPSTAVSQTPPSQTSTKEAAVPLQSNSPIQPSAAALPGNVDAGKDLFTGRTRFQNGGPACASCHSTATLPFPGGGTMAPDLTHEYTKLGPDGMHYALRTLYFPAMNALFLKRQLTGQEERDLTAFFQNADQSQRSSGFTRIFGGAGLLGLGVLIGITWMSGRGRVHSVRQKLLKRAGMDRRTR